MGKARETAMFLGEEVEIISRYTRAEAIADGVLVDVTRTAQEAGFVVPVAVTVGVWTLVCPTEAEAAFGQDEAGRLWDVLWMAFLAARRFKRSGIEPGPEVEYVCLFELRGREGVTPGLHEQRLKLHSGPGDAGEHVITIMLPHED